MSEGQGQFPESLPVNSKRVQRQQGRDITVIVGNPPYSIGQRSATDDNQNVGYPRLARRIENTYVTRSQAGNKRSLYDSYKMAIRWASGPHRGPRCDCFRDQTAPSLTAMQNPVCEPAWPTNSPICMCSICVGTSALRESGRDRREARCLAQVPALL